MLQSATGCKAATVSFAGFGRIAASLQVKGFMGQESLEAAVTGAQLGDQPDVPWKC